MIRTPDPDGRPSPDPLWAVFLAPRRCGGRLMALARPRSGRRTTALFRHAATFPSAGTAELVAATVDARTRRGRRVVVERL